MPREPAGRLQHFQDRFSIPRKVTCHQSRHIARNITRHMACQITLQISLQRTRQITRSINRQIPRQITCYITRQIIIIIVSHDCLGTVAITYQVAITFSRKANLRLSLQHLYVYCKLKSLLVLYFKGALQRCFAPLHHNAEICLHINGNSKIMMKFVH